MGREKKEINWKNAWFDESVPRMEDDDRTPTSSLSYKQFKEIEQLTKTSDKPYKAVVSFVDEQVDKGNIKLIHHNNCAICGKPIICTSTGKYVCVNCVNKLRKRIVPGYSNCDGFKMKCAICGFEPEADKRQSQMARRNLCRRCLRRGIPEKNFSMEYLQKKYNEYIETTEKRRTQHIESKILKKSDWDKVFPLDTNTR